MTCEVAVEVTAVQEFGVGAGGGDAAGVEDDDLVGIGHGGQPVGHDQHGSPDGSRADGLVHGALVASVETRGWLVEQEQRGVTDQCAGDRQALAFPAGQAHAVVSDHGVQAVGVLLDALQQVYAREDLPACLLYTSPSPRD